MLKTTTSIINASQITGVLPILNGGTGVTTKTGTGSVVLSAAPTLSGDVSLSTGNIVPATAAKGVNFTANTPAAGMTSQLLNWYEEGTFTPTLTTDGIPVTTYTTQFGQYTRIGNTVFIQLGIVWSAFSGTGSVQIGGLPFPASLANPAKTISMPITSSTNAGLVNYSLSDFRTSGGYSALYVYSFDGTTASIATVGASGTLTVKGHYYI